MMYAICYTSMVTGYSRVTYAIIWTTIHNLLHQLGLSLKLANITSPHYPQVNPSSLLLAP